MSGKQTLVFSRFCLEESQREKRDPAELVTFQGSPHQSLMLTGELSCTSELLIELPPLATKQPLELVSGFYTTHSAENDTENSEFQ